MASNYTPNDAFTDPVVVTDDGDAANATSFNTAPEANADRTEFLRNRLLPAAGNQYHAALHSQYPGTANNWVYQTGPKNWRDVAVAGDFMDHTLPVPTTGRMTLLTAEGQGGAALAPVTKVKVELFRLSAAGATLIATATDNEGSASYNTRHTFSQAFTEDISDGNIYMIRVTGEDTTINYDLFDVRVTVIPAP